MSVTPHAPSGDPPAAPEVPDIPQSYADAPERHTNYGQRLHQTSQDFQYPRSPYDNNNPQVIQTCPPSKEHIARRLQRIDIILNLIYSRVANDRSLRALLPFIPEQDARNLVSNFAYVRHQQDTQEIKSEMTDKQTYRIFRHHYRAEQRLAGTLRELRHSTTELDANQLQEKPSESKPPAISTPLTHLVTDLENDTVKVRLHHLNQVERELNEMSNAYQSDDDLLYVQEFSQAQQIVTMQARCVSMKDEYEADDLQLRSSHCSSKVNEVKMTPKETVSGPEEWEDHAPQPEETASDVPGFIVLNGAWTPPDPPRSPCPNERESHAAAPPDANYVNLEGAQRASEVYPAVNQPLPFFREHRQRRFRRETRNGLPEYRHEKSGKKNVRNPDNLDKKTQLSGRAERRDRKGSSSRHFRGKSPKGNSGSQLDELYARQQRYSGSRPPLPDRNQGRRHYHESRPTQVTSKRPGLSLRASRAHVNPKNSSLMANHATTGESRYYYGNAEFASLPNLPRTSFGRRKETSYDDVYTSSGQNYYGNGRRVDPSRKPFPHESADAFGWKPWNGTMGRQHHSGFSHEQPTPLYPQPADPPGQPNLPAPSLPEWSSPITGLPTNSAAQAPVATETRKRDEWRYNNLTSGLLEGKEGLGVMKSFASKVKGKKKNETVPHNPIQVMQLARKDPAKFMTTMVAGELMPQAKRKAQKFEYMLANEARVNGVSGPVGKVLTKVAKQSLAHGTSSKTGIAGEVGKMLGKMTLETTLEGGSSKANASSDVGNVLAKVAKESMKNTGGSSSGAKMIKQVMHSFANT